MCVCVYVGMNFAQQNTKVTFLILSSLMKWLLWIFFQTNNQKNMQVHLVDNLIQSISKRAKEKYKSLQDLNSSDPFLFSIWGKFSS